VGENNPVAEALTSYLTRALPKGAFDLIAHHKVKIKNIENMERVLVWVIQP